MKVSIFGAGYVGLVTGVCLAELGHEVMCVDVDVNKVSRLQQGECPIYEPGLTPLLQRNIAAQRLHFTTDLNTAVTYGTCLFIAVGTPPQEDGSADLRYVLAAARAIAQNMQEFKVVIVKSTVPVGTNEQVRAAIQQELAQLGSEINFAMVSNPEFLKEGDAISDFMQPDRVVLGISDDTTRAYLNELYAAFSDKLLFMDIPSAELSKYAANAMLASRISFINEISAIAEKAGANIETVSAAMGKDPRIGPYFLRAGCGYGGSCFPKDVRALAHTAEQLGVHTPILTAVEKVNAAQKTVLLAKLKQHFGAKLSDCTIAIWGLAFKPNTDDIREASSRVLIDALLQESVRAIRAYDPVAMPAFAQIYDSADVTLVDSLYEAATGADVVVIVTEWKEFIAVDWARVLPLLRQAVVVDGRNLYDLAAMQQLPLTYYSIGRVPVGENYGADYS